METLLEAVWCDSRRASANPATAVDSGLSERDRPAHAEVVLVPVGGIQRADDDLALGTAGVNHAVTADVDADMRVRLAGGVEEDQITRLAGGAIEFRQGHGHLVGGAGQADAVTAIHVLHQSAAVEAAARRFLAPAVGNAAQTEGIADHGQVDGSAGRTRPGLGRSAGATVQPAEDQN